MRWCRVPILLAVLCAAAVPARGQKPKAAALHPLLRLLTSVSVGPGREYRALLMYPLVAADADPSGAKPFVTSVRAAKAGDLSVAEPPQQPGGSKLHLYNWSPEPILLLGGELFTGGVRDRFLARDALLPPARRVEAPAYPADRRGRKKDERRRTLDPRGVVAPDLLRLLALTRAPASAADAFLREVAALAGAAPGGRQDLASVLETPRLAPRIAEYRTIFAPLPDEEGKRVVGVAVYAADRLVGIDLFPTNAAFRASWPGLLRNAAFQAALHEAVNGLLKLPFGPGRDPERRSTELRRLLKKVFGARPRPVKALGLGEETAFTRDALLARTLCREGRLVHAVLLLNVLDEPGAPPPTGRAGEPTPGELERRAARSRLTEYERRLLERMRHRRRPAADGGALRPPAPGTPGRPRSGGGGLSPPRPEEDPSPGRDR